MLEFERILIRNFKSYADYDTIIKLDDLGPCLVVGQVVDAPFAGEDGKDNNGAGKSNITDAILWCLFGRTSRKAKPGDGVINWFTKKNCVVQIWFKNGDSIRRTRNFDGHSDLLYIKNGVDISLGTSTAEQSRLNKELGLDWDIFCGSSFFSQFGNTWLQISDVKRRAAMEREFHLDRIQYYDESAKERCDKVLAEQSRLKYSLNELQKSLDSYKLQTSKLTEASAKFNEQKELRLKQARRTLDEAIASRDAIKLVDVDHLEKQWAIVESAESKLLDQDQEYNDLVDKKRGFEIEIRHQQNLIDNWSGKGEICSSCEQTISKEYVGKKIGTPQAKIVELQAKSVELSTTIASKKLAISNARQRLNSKKPSMTVASAEDAHKQWRRYDNNVVSQQNAITTIENEQNHYDSVINDNQIKISEIEKEIADNSKTVSKMDKLLLHLNYIYRAYHDRRKIKSYILSEYVPYLNTRIAHYLERFGLDIRIEFTDALSVKSSLWDYEYFSGGETKRCDVALMMAMFDLHSLMYGRQSNIIVFDEVDQPLDPRGAEIFADVVNNEFADRVDTVLIISQRIDMRGAFPSEIRITRENRSSRVAEIIK